MVNPCVTSAVVKVILTKSPSLTVIVLGSKSHCLATISNSFTHDTGGNSGIGGVGVSSVEGSSTTMASGTSSDPGAGMLDDSGVAGWVGVHAITNRISAIILTIITIF